MEAEDDELVDRHPAEDDELVDRQVEADAQAGQSACDEGGEEDAALGAIAGWVSGGCWQTIRKVPA